VSFDVYFQAFEAGDAPGGGDAARAVLDPYLTGVAPGAHLLSCAGGSADVYGLDSDSMMVTHIEGVCAWSLLVEAARAASWVVMPVGCPVCVLDEVQLEHLPEELRDDVRVITSGEDLLAVIHGSDLDEEG
jgi:hypothetical protein